MLGLTKAPFWGFVFCFFPGQQILAVWDWWEGAANSGGRGNFLRRERLGRVDLCFLLESLD